MSNIVEIPKDTHTCATCSIPGMRHSNVDPKPAWGRWGDDGRIYIRCQCGKCMDLDHTIDATGFVQPSLFHEPGCGWHVFGRLMDYDGKGLTLT